MSHSDRDDLIKLIKDTGINWATTPELLADTILESEWFESRMGEVWEDGKAQGYDEGYGARDAELWTEHDTRPERYSLAWDRDSG